MVLLDVNSKVYDAGESPSVYKTAEITKTDMAKSRQKNILTDDDEYFEHLTSEQLNMKIKMFRNLCLENKINASNAFDIDLIGHFAFWLEKNKQTNNADICSFQEMADNLEASAKIYGFRVDNFSENTSKLVEQVRAIKFKKDMAKLNDGNEPIKIQKPKRLKMMLTVADKLKRKQTEVNQLADPTIKQNSNFDFNELFDLGRPSNYPISLYLNTSLKEELDNSKVKTINNEKNYYSISYIQGMFSKQTICPNFCGFLSEEDKINIGELVPQLEGIENRFDPNDHPYQNMQTDVLLPNSTCTYDDCNAMDISPLENNEPEISRLLNCMDDIERDYSFFNPQLLAKWKGPKAWKTHAMVKALKSCKPYDRKNIKDPSNEIDIDDISQICKQPKTPRRRNKILNETIKLNWTKIDKIAETLENNTQSKETLLPRILQKWDALDNLGDTKGIIIDIKHKFMFLEHTEIRPNWWLREKNKKNKIEVKDYSQHHENNNELHESIYDNTLNDSHCGIINDDPIMSQIQDINSKCDDSYTTNKLCSEVDFCKPEVHLDIGTLKKQIIEIINKECIISSSSSNWSSALSFKDLLIKLNFFKREDLSVPLVFVALLHLSNEHSLSLTQTLTLNVNEIDDVKICKPIKLH
ncbi:condensin complex subunit 2-like [Daktulosphaira vitifoliae]|uniref:condensin complex subunit 2-like n=1 Tax=Daktulosphaira vitifoliae TaxID=58002 RepID=UPI0021A9A77E|nr:condensin complex subunit 2-like [Daktulosphaira vitifoliae]